LIGANVNNPVPNTLATGRTDDGVTALYMYVGSSDGGMYATNRAYDALTDGSMFDGIMQRKAILTLLAPT